MRTPCLFDPELDVAFLHVPGSGLPALRFASGDPTRGAIGATLGYPGGGRLEVLPAAVAARTRRPGATSTARRRVRRQILELRAAIDRGDSGGPLILQDGTVGGVVFAEARTDPDVGYALSPTEVATRVAPGDRPDRGGRHRRLRPLIARSAPLYTGGPHRDRARTDPMPDERHPYDRPIRSGEAPFRGPDRRPRSGRRAGDAQGHRVHRRGPRQAARRRRRRPGSRRCRATTTSGGWRST